MEQPRQRQPLNETQGLNTSETAIRGIVKEILLEFMTEQFTKTLTEDVIKRTINTLLKEGKLKKPVAKKPVPKKRSIGSAIK